MLPASRDGQALLRAVLCTPDDDAPRLILADWLDEHGDEARASLIRRMIALPTYVFFWSRRWKRPCHVHKESRRAIRGLLGQVWPICAKEWEPWPEVEEVVVRRGFVESITMRSFDFLRLAIELFPFHPIQDVNLWDLPPRYIPERRGWTRAALVRDGYGAGHWPAVLFPEYAHRRELVYEGASEARTDLSRHACAYGRWLAMVPKEPPLSQKPARAPLTRRSGWDTTRRSIPPTHRGLASASAGYNSPRGPCRSRTGASHGAARHPGPPPAGRGPPPGRHQLRGAGAAAAERQPDVGFARQAGGGST